MLSAHCRILDLINSASSGTIAVSATSQADVPVSLSLNSDPVLSVVSSLEAVSLTGLRLGV